MATNKPRFPITIEPETAEIIENYRHQHKINSTSKATVELLIKGIDEFYRAESEREDKKNIAPTAESAAEALYEVLYYYLGHPPTAGEIDAFRGVMPIISRGIDGVA